MRSARKSGATVLLSLGAGFLSLACTSNAGSTGDTNDGGVGSGPGIDGGKGGDGGGSGGASGGSGDTGAGDDGGLGKSCPVGAASPTATGTDSVMFLNGVTVDTLAGGAAAGTANGTGASATFSNPVSIARVDASTFVVADYDSSLLRIVTPSGAVSTMTTPHGFIQPYGLAEADGTIFVQTDQNSAGDKSPQTGTIWSTAVIGPPAVFKENIGRPRAIARLSATTLALADFQHDTVEVLDRSTMNLTVLAGTKDCIGFAEGPGNAALFNSLGGIVVRSDGSLVVSDSGNRRIRLVSAAGVVSTLAGEGTAATVDGPGSAARFVMPRALAIDASDNIYVSDTGARRIRRIDPAGNVVTVAGAGGDTNGFQDGQGSAARFAGQEGIALSADGKTLYVADGNGGTEVAAQTAYHRIRRVMLP